MIIYLSFGLIILALLAVLSVGVVVLLGRLLGALIGGILGRKTGPEEVENFSPTGEWNS
jgi:hypothetical protein